MRDATVRLRRRTLSVLVTGAVLVLGGTAPALCGGIAIVEVVLSDNGDDDGFADTNETVHMVLELQNTSGSDLTGVTAILSTSTPDLVCPETSLVTIGDMLAGEIKSSPPFVFHVLDVDRTAMGLDEFGELTASFEILVSTGNAGLPRVVAPFVRLDLDLDVSAGSGPTTFFEGFESETLGAFEVENLDQGKHSLAAADGYRCQESDPDWENSSSYGAAIGEVCYLGASVAHADAVHWGLSGPAFSPLAGRAFSGQNSAYFGTDLGPPLNWTTPMATLEAVRTSEPIYLDWDGVSPTLSIKHQVSLADHRCFTNVPVGSAMDRGVVMAQVADDSGTSAGPWIKLHAYQNAYDQRRAQNFFDCGFDPIDDGNTEDDFFDPTDPARRFGPSSTCGPEYVFADIGDTSQIYGPDKVGNADGPGLQGFWGDGTWIESKFDLGRFRGRRVRLRFLASTNKLAEVPETWEDAWGWNPASCDDGWWIDDITLAGTLVDAATVDADTSDNSGLPGPSGGDDDGDGVFDVCDNCVMDGNTDQRDQDLDGLGDICDPCITEPWMVTNVDLDGDQICTEDNCPTVPNPDQTDDDNDHFGAACECDDSERYVYPGAVERNDGLDNQCPGDLGYGVVDELSGLAGFYDPNDKTKFSWPNQQLAYDYEAVQASSADFSTGCTLTALPITQTWVAVTGFLPGRQVRYVLARPVLPNVGSWGQDSSFQERVIPCAP
jgi:hypothetical protein